jgi:hypothetical protein
MFVDRPAASRHNCFSLRPIEGFFASLERAERTKRQSRETMRRLRETIRQSQEARRQSQEAREARRNSEALLLIAPQLQTLVPSEQQEMENWRTAIEVTEILKEAGYNCEFCVPAQLQ